MLRASLLALVSLLACAATAHAAPPAAKPPDARKLRAVGVKVTWPRTTTLAAGQAVTVKVSSSRAAPATGSRWRA